MRERTASRNRKVSERNKVECKREEFREVRVKWNKSLFSSFFLSFLSGRD